MYKYISTPSTTRKQRNRKDLIAELKNEIKDCKVSIKELKVSLNQETKPPKTIKKSNRRKSFYSPSDQKTIKTCLKKTIRQPKPEIRAKKKLPPINFKGKKPYIRSPLSKRSYPK